jgi:hypothetical protein
MANEVILNPSDKEPVATEEVSAQLTNGAEEIAKALRVRAQQRNYNPTHVQETLDYLSGKTAILAKGLLPAEDHTFLSGVIDNVFGMAHTSARYSNEIEPSERVIRWSVDTIHVTMVVNNLISEEAKAELEQLWPLEEPKTAAD